MTRWMTSIKGKLFFTVGLLCAIIVVVAVVGLVNLKDGFAARRFGKWDVIFCRNVLIYFDDGMKGHCARLFHKQLNDDGTLFIEPTEQRRDAGKPEAGMIRLLTEHQGSHVRLAIEDDGKGIDRQLIADKAVQKGLATAEQVDGMSDEEVFRFIFAAGFSTAEQVSDLSGRGVGMDVVQTNVNKMNGTVNVRSEKGRGTSIDILIPLTVAIMPALAVEVGKHLYCVPLQNISEIVRPEPTHVSTVNGQPVLRLRESVLPLLDLRRCLDEPAPAKARFAVVIQVGSDRIGLLVDWLIGQQDIVIKPLDDSHAKGGPFSGATIQDDGRVSLILDVAQLRRRVQMPDPTPAERRAA